MADTISCEFEFRFNYDIKYFKWENFDVIICKINHNLFANIKDTYTIHYDWLC